jgi:hypothetical protein
MLFAKNTSWTNSATLLMLSALSAGEQVEGDELWIPMVW